MTLLEEILRTNLTQQLTVTKDTDIVAIRPKLYVAGAPGGNVKVQILDSNGELKNESSTVNISTFSTLNFAHKYFQFDVNSPVKEDEVIQIRIVAGGGYAPTESVYVSWLLDFDLRKYTATYSPSTGGSSPFDLEVWTKRRIGMVRELDFADGFESSAQPSTDTESAIVNNTAAPADVPNMAFSVLDFESVTIGYSLYRTDDATDKKRSGTLKLQHKPVANTATLEDENEHDTIAITGVTLTPLLTGTTMKVQYISTDFSGQTKGFIKWAVTERFTPGA